VDEATWLAVTTALTGLGAAWTWYAFRHRGAASGVRGAAITLLFPAMFLTGSTETAAEIGQALFDWATGLVLSPLVWVGLALFGLSAVLFVVAGFLRNRAAGSDERATGEVTGQKEPESLPPASQRSEPAIDDDLSEIEAILKKRGIT
jgi:hypothetical protein